MGGEIVKIAKGNYIEKATNITNYSGGDINSIAGKKIVQTSEDGHFFGDADEAPDNNITRGTPITIECFVEFRPKDTWVGEFGFDWLRKGDYKDSAGLFNNIDYKDIVAKQYIDARHRTLETDSNEFRGHFKENKPLLVSIKNEYNPTKISWKHKEDNRGNTIIDASGKPVMDEFHTSYLSIYKKESDPDVSVTIQAYIHVKKEPDELKIKLEEAQKEFFTIAPENLTKTVTSGTPTMQDITITCKKTFATDQVLKVIAIAKKVGDDFCGDPNHKEQSSITKEEVVGKLIIKANNRIHRKTKKVLFIGITTKLRRRERTGNTSNYNTGNLKKYLKQALIDLHSDSTTETLNLVNLYITKADGTRVSVNTKFNGRYVTNGEIDDKGGIIGSLDYFFKEALRQNNPLDANKYDDYFKVFIFDEKGYHPDPTLSKAGFAFPGSDYTVLLKNSNDQTAAHEILHALNLAHTFSNSEADANAQYTFTYKSINNLLSYTHHKGVSNAAYKTARYSLQHWQWAIANTAADPE